MKPKKMKKLSIKKTTVANLGAEQLLRAKGGVLDTVDPTCLDHTCFTCPITRCGFSCYDTCLCPPQATVGNCLSENINQCPSEVGYATCNGGDITC